LAFARFPLIVALAAASLAATNVVMAQTETWVGAASGTWNTPSNWSPSSVPGSSNVAVIAATGSPYTVTLSGGTAASIASFTLSSPNATLLISSDNMYLYGNGGSSSLASGSTLQLNSGSIVGFSSSSGNSVTNGAGASIVVTGGSNYIGGDNSVGSAMTLTNSGSISVATGSLDLGYYATDTFTNTSTGNITASGTGVINLVPYGGSNSFSNSGTITATSGGTINFGGNFNSTNLGGTINGAGGTLNITGTVTVTGTLAPPSDYASGGIYTLDGGTLQNGTVTPTALTFSNSYYSTLSNMVMSGVFTIPTSAEFTVENGTTFPNDVIFDGSDYVYLSGTTAAVLTIPSGVTWTGMGPIYSYALAGGLTVLNQGTMNLQGGDFGGNYQSGFTFNNAGTITNTYGVLQFGNYPYDTVVNTGPITSVATGSNYTYVYIGNGSNTTVTNSSAILASETGSSVSQMNIGIGASATVTNSSSGSIVASQTGTTYATAVANVGTGNATTVSNAGLLEATGAGASLYLGFQGTGYSSTWTNSGTIEALNGGAVYLGGYIYDSTLTNGTIDGAGGTLFLVGTLNHSGILAGPTDYLSGGIYTLYGGEIDGGTVNAANNALTFSSQGGTLNGVTMTGNFNVPANGSFTVENGTTFSGNMTFAGNNNIYLQGASATVLTINPGLTWTANGTLNVYAGANNETILNEGTMNLQGGTIFGYYTTGFAFDNVAGASITNTYGQLQIGAYSGDTVTNAGPITALAASGNYSYVDIANGTGSSATNSSTIEASTTGSSSSYLYVASGYSGSLVNSGTILVSQTGTGYATGFIGTGNGSTVTNTGTIEATGTNSALYLGYDGPGPTYTSSWTNIGGTIAAVSGGAVYLGGTMSSSTLTGGTIDGAGGSLYLVGTLNNNGTLVGPNDVLSGGIYTLYGGEIDGGTVNAANHALTFGNQGGTLNGVAMVGNFSIPSSGNFEVENGTTFSGDMTFGGGSYIYLGGTNPSALTIGSGLTWTANGPIYSYAEQPNLTVLNQGTMNLQGGYFGGDYNSGYNFINQGTITNTVGTLSLGNFGNEAITNSGTITVLDTTNQYPEINIASGSNTSLVNSATIEANNSGSGQSYLTIADGTSSSAVNTGSILAVQTGTGTSVAYFGEGDASNVTNAAGGVLEANGTGASMYIGYPYVYYSYTSAWTNAGTIEAVNGGKVYLGGTFSNSTLTQGTIDGAGGFLGIVGTLNNSGTLAGPSDVLSGGIYTLDSGTIIGGTVNAANNALTFDNNDGLLDDVTMVGDFTIPANAIFSIENGTSFSGNMTFGGNNTIYVEGTTANVLTIPSGKTWTATGPLNFYAYAIGLTIQNQGTLNMQGGGFSGDYNANFVLNNSGTINNTSGSLSLASYPGDSVVNTGVINSTSTSSNYSYMYISDGSNSTLTNSGTIEAMTTGSGYATAYVGYGTPTTVTNTGLLEANGSNATLTLGYANSTWYNTGGTILATNGGTVDLYGAIQNSTLTGGTINATGGTVNLLGTMTNSGTLNAPNGGGIFTLDGATINGGTIASGAVTFGTSTTTLNGVAMTGNFTLPSASNTYIQVQNNTTFSGGTTTFSPSNYNVVYVEGASASTALTVAADETWTGNMALYNSSGNPLNVVFQGIIDHLAGSSYFYGEGYGLTMTNSGTLEASGGGSLTLGYGNLDYLTNTSTGTIEASGSQIYLDQNLSVVTNFTGTTLSGGTWVAAAGGLIDFETTTNTIVTNAPGTTLVLSGSGSNIESGPSSMGLEHTLTTNNGTLEVLANRNYVGATAIANNGTIELGGGTLTATSLTNATGSVLSGYGTFNPTGGVTVGSGVLVSPGSTAAGSYIGTLDFNTLTLGAGGSMVFDVSNAAGTAGTGYDTINVTGTANITASSITPFNISIESINMGSGTPGLASYTYPNNYQWTLLTSSTLTTFSASDFNLTDGTFVNGGVFSITSSGNDILLNFTPVPEPSTWALMLSGAAAAGLIAWRRRRSQVPQATRS
jgi:fibronectin-binding autotransporter adhesin